MRWHWREMFHPILDWRVSTQDPDRRKDLDEKRDAISYRPRRGFLRESHTSWFEYARQMDEALHRVIACKDEIIARLKDRVEHLKADIKGLEDRLEKANARIRQLERNNFDFEVKE